MAALPKERYNLIRRRARELIKLCGGTAWALSAACECGDSDAAVCLVKDFGVDVNVRDSGGGTAVHTAASHGRHEVIRVLVDELGAVVDTKDIHEWTALHSAAYQGKDETIRVLVKEYSADVGAKTLLGQTPLHIAAQGGRLEAIRVLARLGADVGAKDRYGNTPLHSAVSEQGNHEVLRVLVDELGADVDAVANGSTALDMAAQSGDLVTVRQLKGYGATGGIGGSM